jgi:hypothetical protein
MENKERFPLSHGTAAADLHESKHLICCTWSLSAPTRPVLNELCYGVGFQPVLVFTPSSSYWIFRAQALPKLNFVLPAAALPLSDHCSQRLAGFAIVGRKLEQMLKRRPGGFRITDRTFNHGQIDTR